MHAEKTWTNLCKHILLSLALRLNFPILASKLEAAMSMYREVVSVEGTPVAIISLIMTLRNFDWKSGYHGNI